ncbi:MAG: HD-GYP domain-containing protein [Candidatus Rokubacteria bacterium]|nr:HD-GYP domain-containing protein [Candidatus Rokubacteria bacterium]
MAGEVEISQVLLYARDLKSQYERSRARERQLALAYRRLRAAYQQSLRYALDLRDVHGRLQRAFLQSLLGLANALEARDPYTRGHSERVARLAQRLALRLGCSADERRVITQAGLLHDLGKIGIPEAVLGKAGPLSEEEWVLMREHPVVGARIVSPLEFFSEGALIIRHHHERQDGSGYPAGLSGEAIPFGARIMAVADVYDAMTSDRPYRKRLACEEARRQVEGWADRLLDARIVSAFLGLPADGCFDPTV